MTRDETKVFMRRIKEHYQEFLIDEFKVDEWHNVLKDYELKDVNNKLEEHLRSQEFGNHIPKVYFLTKYLRTIQEKENAPKYKLFCPLCKDKVSEEDFKQHYDRCSSINYINMQYKKYFNKTLDVDMLKKMGDEEFKQNYDKVLKFVYENTENENEKHRIECILNNRPFNISNNVQIQITEF